MTKGAMNLTNLKDRKGSVALIGLIIVQALCATFFVEDLIADMGVYGLLALSDRHLLNEGLATLALIVAIVFEFQFLMRLLRRQSRTQKALDAASGALGDLVEEYFSQWGLTPSEEDVAAFTLKGYSIAEIAELRGSREGTVKAHLNAIYRKAGVAGRSQLVSILIEDLMQGALGERAQKGTGKTAP